MADHWLLSLALATISVALIRFRTGVDADAWLHLRIGRELRRGEWFQSLPDPLVVLADRPYVPTQWLSEIVGTLAWDAGGVVGLRALRAVALLVTFGAVYLTARRLVSPPRATGIVLVVAFASSAAWAERPQMAGLALAAVTLFLWAGTLHDGRPRWALVPATWLWAMLHGTWAVGLATGAVMVLATAAARRGEARWPGILACLGACAAVVAATPLGPGLLVEPFAVTASARRGVNEWQPPTLGNPVYLLVLLAAAVVLWRVVRRRPADLAAAVLALSAAGLAAYSVRTVAFGALLLAPALGRAFAVDRPAPRGRRELVPLTTAAAVLCAVPGVVWGGPSSGPLGSDLDRALAGLPAGAPVAVDVRVSGWVLHEHPQVVPLRDLRAEVYSAPTAEAYEAFAHGAGDWPAYAAEHGVVGILTAQGSALDDGLAARMGWSAAASDDMYRLWIR